MVKPKQDLKQDIKPIEENPIEEFKEDFKEVKPFVEKYVLEVRKVEDL